MVSDDPLRTLVVDAVEIDRQRIADALRGVIAIDKSGQVIPANFFPQLTASQKVLAFLLGRKVAALLDLAEEEAIGPTDLAKSTGMAGGTVYPTVREIHGRRLISQDVDSRYYLSPHQVGTAIDELSADRAGDDAAKGTRQRRVARRKPKGRAARREAEGSTAKPKESEGRKRQTSGRFSPTSTIRDLIADGYFDQPKTLTEVQKHFKDKEGREVAVTTLSPLFTRLLRGRALDRDRHEDGTYQYVRKATG